MALGQHLEIPLRCSSYDKLMDPTELAIQVGAISRAQCGSIVCNEGPKCASSKSNMGHLEAGAAAAGLASQIAMLLGSLVVNLNAHLIRSPVFDYTQTCILVSHRLNVHLHAILPGPLLLPCEILVCMDIIMHCCS